MTRRRWQEPVDWNSDYVTHCMLWAFISPLGVTILLFLTFPLWSWLVDW